jgi:hypothetical protein
MFISCYPDNHHRVEGSDVVHTVSGSPVDAAAANELYYYPGTNNHPTAEGHQKATAEYVPLLNAYYYIWQDNTWKWFQHRLSGPDRLILCWSVASNPQNIQWMDVYPAGFWRGRL